MSRSLRFPPGATHGTSRSPFQHWLRSRPLMRPPPTSGAVSFAAVAVAPCRAFSAATPWRIKAMPPRPPHPPESEMSESFVKGSGPGGQKINKTNSAVQLKHLPTGIVVKCQATRSREQNRKIARDLLAARLDVLRNGDQSRQAIVADVKRRRKASATKKSKRKYRRLEGERGGAAVAEEEEDDDRVSPGSDGPVVVKEPPPPPMQSSRVPP